MKFFLITNCPDVAAFGIASGADRIFVDLEINGKEARQGHLNTVISRHSLFDVGRVRAAVPAGRLLVRINPVHAGTANEVGAVLDAGADELMLPMFRAPEEVAVFCRAIAGRARAVLLVETAAAARALGACVRVPGVDEVHIGLNDLHLELGMDFMFEPLANGMVDELAAILRAEGKPFGIGGVARVGEGLLPAELLLAEHARLGSGAAILSRTFHRQANSVEEIRTQMDFAAEITKLRQAYASAQHADSLAQQRNTVAVREGVAQIVAAVRARKGVVRQV